MYPGLGTILEPFVTAANLVQLLRRRYERVRLDLSGTRDASYRGARMRRMTSDSVKHRLITSLGRPS
jgi:hypothetical protein